MVIMIEYYGANSNIMQLPDALSRHSDLPYCDIPDSEPSRLVVQQEYDEDEKYSDGQFYITTPCPVILSLVSSSSGIIILERMFYIS